MPLSDFTLQKNQVILSQNENSKNGIVIDNSSFLYGTVEAVDSITTLFVVGQRVLFDGNDATQFVYSNNYYYLIEGDKIKLIEL
jgi:hypothetical protein